MFVLFLNHMTGSYENSVAIARAGSREALEALLVRERVEPYRDGNWSKTFRRGGPLEWFNAHDRIPNEHCGIRDVGTADSWAAAARENFDRQVMSMPLAEALR